jgi:hypothetical protein
MIRMLVKKLTTAAVAGVAVLGCVGSAQAATVVGRWDPAFGAPFNVAGSSLGWSGTTQFTIDDSCASSGTVAFFQCAMTIDSATVNFYNMASPSTIVESLTFAPPPQIPLSMYVPTSGAFPAGVDTNGTLGSVLSTTSGLAALTLGTNYFFDLEFAYNIATGNQEVRLYYTLFDSLDPRKCAGGGLGQSRFCGASSEANGPVVMTITPVPEPSTYALMLAALGAVGFTARRRRRG